MKGKKMTKNTITIKFLILSVLLVTSISCRVPTKKQLEPGSFAEMIAEGNVKFSGNGNVTYIGCQDPTAVVSLFIGPKTKEIYGQKSEIFVSPVTVDVTTDGTQIKIEGCQKTNLDEKYSWPVKGIYYPEDGEILFTSCTTNNFRAEGKAYLEGEGFEGEYACYDHDGDLMYEVAISAYEMSK